MLQWIAGEPVVFFTLVLLVSIFSTAFGIGGFVLLPIITIVYGPKAGVGLITLYYLCQTVNKWIAFREYVEWEMTRKLVYWSIPGAIIGAVGLVYVSEGALSKLLAVFILIYLANDVFSIIPTKRYNVALVPIFGLLYGAVSGFLGGGGNIVRGPFLASMGLRKESFVATNAVAGFFINIPKLVIYTGSGIVTYLTLHQAIPFLIISTVGTYIGKFFLGRIHEKVFYYALNAIFALTAIGLFFQ